MGRVARIAAAGLVLVLVLIGCGSQQPDDRQTEDKSEEVYIFPDGTEVRGDAAAWVRDVKDQFKLGQVDVKTITPEMITGVFGDAFATPQVPERFHLLGYTMTHNPEADFRIAQAAWVHPDGHEVVLVTAAGQFSTDGDGAFVEVEPMCYEPKDQVIKDANGQVTAVERKIPWSQLECAAAVSLNGVRIAVRTVNVPKDEAVVMLNEFLRAQAQ